MRKAFGFILTVVLAMSLIGCSDKKATTTEEVTSTEVKATVTEAPTTEVPTTKATVSDATSTDATATDASSTDATVSEASANDAEKTSTSNEITENVVLTENVDDMKFFSDKGEDENKRMILGYYGDIPFEIFIAEKGEESIDVTLNEHTDSEYLMFYLSGDVESSSLSEENPTAGAKMIYSDVVEFSVTYKDGKTVNVTVHVPEA